LGKKGEEKKTLGRKSQKGRKKKHGKNLTPRGVPWYKGGKRKRGWSTPAGRSNSTTQERSPQPAAKKNSSTQKGKALN